MDVRNFVVAERVKQLLDEHIAKSHYHVDNQSSQTVGGLRNVAFYTSVNERCLSDIIHGRRSKVSVTTLDRILTGLNLEYLAHFDAGEGGFKDVYDNIQTLPPRKGSRKKKPVSVCPQCGGGKQRASRVCAECFSKNRVKELPCCESCGATFNGKYRRKTGLCRSCYDKTKPEYRVRYRNTMSKKLDLNRLKLDATRKVR